MHPSFSAKRSLRESGADVTPDSACSVCGKNSRCYLFTFLIQQHICAALLTPAKKSCEHPTDPSLYQSLSSNTSIKIPPPSASQLKSVKCKCLTTAPLLLLLLLYSTSGGGVLQARSRTPYQCARLFHPQQSHIRPYPKCISTWQR